MVGARRPRRARWDVLTRRQDKAGDATTDEAHHKLDDEGSDLRGYDVIIITVARTVPRHNPPRTPPSLAQNSEQNIGTGIRGDSERAR